MSSVFWFSIPQKDLFQIPPSSEPVTLQPVPGSTPFRIPTNLYNSLLDFRAPLLAASFYACLVTFFNSYNRKHANRPWTISKTKLFSIFTILHNVVLAVYSAWTFLGMWGTLQRSISSPYGHDGVVGTIDSLCKIHGPPGLGESLIYNTTLSKWVPQSTLLPHLESEASNLQSFGRLWNEGLAFYGWLFYVSKFYEVLDTLIILAKGKCSGTLQTYHHSGAMLCMWAGIRFMSPPIWMFVFVNSAIHALMYTYFTLTALNIKVSQTLKRTLTTTQITQFLVGSLFAGSHLFLHYSYPYKILFTGDTLNEFTSAVVSSTKRAVTTNSTTAKIKALLVTSLGHPSIVHNDVNLPEFKNHLTYHDERINITCLGTSGQKFAIWLNLAYLTPLTYLFIRFFIKSYLQKSTKVYTKTQMQDAKSLLTEKC